MLDKRTEDLNRASLPALGELMLEIVREEIAKTMPGQRGVRLPVKGVGAHAPS